MMAKQYDAYCLRVREFTDEKELRQLRETIGYILCNIPRNRQEGTFEFEIEIANKKRAADRV